MPSMQVSPSTPSNSPDASGEAKQQLVDAVRMLEHAGIIDQNGHCSIRRDAGSFLINSGASVRGALTADESSPSTSTGTSWKGPRSRRSNSTSTAKSSG